MFKLSLEKAVLLMLGAVCVLVISMTYPRESSYSKFGDLRNRVTGTRIWLAGVDPYFFQWKQGMREEWADPQADPNFPVSRLTVPPTALFIMAPIVSLNYKIVVWIWYLIMWGCFLGSCLLLRSLAGIEEKLKTDVLFIAFTGSYFWIHHLLAGQIYVVYIFIFISGIYLINKNLWGGYLLMGLLGGIRLPYLFFGLILVLVGKVRSFYYWLIGLFAVFSMSILIGNWSSWLNYWLSMSTISQIQILAGLVDVDNRIYYPEIIENIKFEFGLDKQFAEFETSIKGIFQIMGINLSIINLFVMFLGALGIFLYVVWQSKKNIKQNILLIGLLSVSGVTCLEYFLPSARYSYYDIQFLMPFGLLIVNGLSWKYIFWIVGLVFLAYVPVLFVAKISSYGLMSLLIYKVYKK